MPFEVRKDDNKFCVFNTDTDENKGCSDSRDQAVAHLKALYTNEAELAAEEVISYLEDDETLTGDNYIFSDGMKEYPWEGPIVFENVTTGDNRVFKTDSINWQEDTLPWAFRWQKASGQGHAGSVPVGRVDRIQRMEDGSIHGYGVVIPELSDEATQYLKLLESGVGGGVSVDGDSAQFDIQEQDKGQPRVEFSSMRLRALSAVDIPAFNGARIHLISSETTELADDAAEELLETVDLNELASEVDAEESDTDTEESDTDTEELAAEVDAEESDTDAEESDTDTEESETGKSYRGLSNYIVQRNESGLYCVIRKETGYKFYCYGTEDEANEQIDELTKRDEERLNKGLIQSPEAKANKKVEAASYGWNIDKALVAASIPVLPSTDAFIDPEFDGPTPLTVTPDGKVFGHLALFNTCHIGFPGTCVKPPKGSKYQYFHTGEIETAEGDLVQVGHLTFKTGHADMNASPRIAADHYDNTGTVAADVRAGEDKHGIWVVGALRPHLSDEDIRAFRCAPLSGDWRRIAGRLELVGALGVNTPGFPVPRVRAMVASGETETLFTFLEDDDEEFLFSDYELDLRNSKKAALAAAVAMNIGPAFDSVYSDYELNLRYGKKVALASKLENSFSDFDLPVGKIEEEIPKAPTKKELEEKVKNYTTSELFADLKQVRELLDDPNEKMSKKVRNGLEEIYKAATMVDGKGHKFSDSEFGRDIVSASGLEAEEWQAQLELSGLDVVEFFNKCHGKGGLFCETKGGGGGAASGKHTVPVGTDHPWHDVPGGGKHGPTHDDGSYAKSVKAPGTPGTPGTKNPKNPQNPQNPQQQQQQHSKVDPKTYENYRQSRQYALRWGSAATVALAALNSPIAGFLQASAAAAGLALLGSPAILGLIVITGVGYASKNILKAYRHKKDYNQQVDKKISNDKFFKAQEAAKQRHLNGP